MTRDTTSNNFLVAPIAAAAVDGRMRHLLAVGILIAVATGAGAQPLEVVATYPVLVHASGTLVASADGRNVYLGGSDPLGYFLHTFRVEDDGAALASVGVLRQAPPFTPDQETLWGLREVVVAPDGRHLYGRAVDRLLVFDRDVTTGLPTLIERRTVAVGRQENDLAAWVEAMALSPDGRHLYAAGPAELVVLRTDTAPLTEVTRFTAGTESFPLWAIVPSPDGRHVYVLRRHAGNRGGEIVAYARDDASGTLTEIGVTRDGDDGFLGLGDPLDLTISPDGRHLYTVTGAHGLVAFARDTAAGTLRTLSLEPRPLPDALGEAFGGFTPDGALLLLPRAILARDPVSGALTSRGSLAEPSATLGEIPSLAVAAPDGEHVYAAPLLTVRRRTCGDATVDAGETCDDGNRVAGDGCSALCDVEPCWTCDALPSVCTPADGVACDDGDPCTTGDVCAAGTCAAAPVADGTACDDGSACTSGDACVAGVCGGTTVACGTCEACDRARGCVGAIDIRCTPAAAGRPGRLALTRRGSAGRRLAWRWRNDLPTTAATLGDPIGAAGLELCIFDRTGVDASATRQRRVAFAAAIPGGCGTDACWRRPADGRFVFRGSGAASDGIRRIVLRTAEAGKIAVTADGGGRHLPAPALPLATESGATVQLRSADGTCFESLHVEPGLNSRRAFDSRRPAMP